MTNQKLPFSYQKITISYVDAAPLFRKNKNRTDSVPTSPCKDAAGACLKRLVSQFSK